MIVVRGSLLLALALCSAALVAATAGGAKADYANYTGLGQGTLSSGTPASTALSGLGTVLVQGYVTESTAVSGRQGLIPIAGARLYFVYNGNVVGYTLSNPVGFYNVSIPAGSGYTVVAGAAGFQTQITQVDFTATRSYDVSLTKIPFNGFVPYALYPVLETSPGRVVQCPIVVENYQVADQMVTFTAVTPTDWQAWFPDGEALMVRSGGAGTLTFSLRYTGSTPGPAVMKVIVNGGAYFAEIPIVVVVKDLPYEGISFWSYLPESVVKPGNTAEFVINAENTYSQDKDLALQIDKPAGWSVTTGNGSRLHVPGGMTGSSDLWVYVPGDAAAGNYTINLSLVGNDTRSNNLSLKVQVDGMPLYDAIIKGPNRTPEGYKLFNVSAGQAFALPVRVFNNWDFPLAIQASAQVGDSWPYTLDGIPPSGRVNIAPGQTVEFSVRSRVPNETYGNFTARVYLEAPGQDMTLIALVAAPAPPPPPDPAADNSWQGVVLTGATAATIALTLAVPFIRKNKP